MITSYVTYRGGLVPETREIVKITKGEPGERFERHDGTGAWCEHGFNPNAGHWWAGGEWSWHDRTGVRWGVYLPEWPWVVWFSDGTYGVIPRGCKEAALEKLGCYHRRDP